MTLTAGTRLGPYAILSPLGAGGMGEVYRARDTKLGRDVAIKVLPQSLSADPDRLSRFEREARVLASLNHPHVAAIYGVEDSTAVKALVLELVEGPTLQDRIEAGAVPVDEALPIARQIAEALEAAHEKGIVHRDLKPANVKLDAEGNVKVLDFGLAKALDPALSSSPDLSDSPTLSVGTQSGMILGTAPYMSPEQARGRPVDKRTDVWAFGVLLWEMLTGRRLFDGDSVADVLGAVMREEIDLRRVPPSVPPRVRELLRRCLERNPRERLRDIGEARIALEHPQEAAPAEAVIPTPVRRGRGLLAGVAVLGVALGLAAGIVLFHRSPATPSFRFQKLTFLPGLEWAPELSADGRTLFFAAGDTNFFAAGNTNRSDIDSVPVGGRKPTVLTTGSESYNDAPRLSPDGSRLVFASSRDGGGLFLMGVNGESVRKLSPVGNDPAWSPDGRTIAYSTEDFFLPYQGLDGGRLGLVDAATGARRELKTGDAHQPSWSPSGRRIAYWGMRRGGNRDVWTVGIDGGAPVDVTNDDAVDWNPVWSEDGRFLYFLSDRAGQMNLWRVRIDEKSGRVLDSPESVPLPADEVIFLARSGRRWVYGAYSSRSTIRRFDFDPVRSTISEAHEVLSMTGSIMSAEPSPDGKSVAFTTLWPQEDVYVVASDGGAAVQLTDDREFDRYVSWSPDGRRLLFESLRGGRYETWAIRPDGSGLEPLTRTAQEESGWVPVLSPAGDRLVTSLAEGVAIFDARGAPPWEHPRRFPPPPGAPGTNFSGNLWSPDGRRLAGYVYRGHEHPVRAAVLDLASGSYRVYDPPSDPIGWSDDGRRLLIVRGDRLAMLDTASGTVSPVSGGPPLTGRVSASRDLHVVLSLEEDREADIWLAEERPSR
ncbi:MAG TPA: protein kinase [Thermoanaerobaculia bacterium]|nr:protein kinase [Thermoanaerobaculia bacterium]